MIARYRLSYSSDRELFALQSRLRENFETLNILTYDQRTPGQIVIEMDEEDHDLLMKVFPKAQRLVA